MREDRLSEWNEHCSSRWHQGAGEAGRGEKRKAKAGWGPGPISPKRGSGEPLTACRRWNPPSARFSPFPRRPRPAGPFCSVRGRLSPACTFCFAPRTDEGCGSVKSSREGFDGVNQILPSELHAFPRLRELCIFGILKVHDAALEIREAGTQGFEFPIVLELDVDF